MMMLGLLLAAIPFAFAVLIVSGRGARPTASRVAVALGFAICEAGGLFLVRRAR